MGPAIQFELSPKGSQLRYLRRLERRPGYAVAFTGCRDGEESPLLDPSTCADPTIDPTSACNGRRRETGSCAGLAPNRSGFGTPRRALKALVRTKGAGHQHGASGDGARCRTSKTTTFTPCALRTASIRRPDKRRQPIDLNGDARLGIQRGVCHPAAPARFYAWSPDGVWLIYLRLGFRRPERIRSPTTTRCRPRSATPCYPTVGRRNPEASLHALAQGRLPPLEVPAPGVEYVLPYFTWT